MTTKRYFSREHEWLEVQDDTYEGVMGITQYAVGQLGDVVFLELPDVGQKLSQGKEAAVIESVKAASEVYAPASGEVLAVNDALAQTPATINAHPTTWMIKFRLTDKAELSALMDEQTYAAYLTSLDA